MLKLRPAQWAVMLDLQVRNGVAAEIPEVRRRLPQATALIADQPLLDLLYQRALNARDQGLAELDSQLAYAELTLLLGAEFTRDPQLPWALHALEGGEDDLWGPWQRLQRRAGRHLAAIRAAEAVAPAHACRAALGLEAAGGLSERAGTARFLDALHRVWPAKAQTLPGPAVTALLERGEALAPQRDWPIPHSALFAFLFGHRFERDALHPWHHAAWPMGRLWAQLGRWAALPATAGRSA